MSANLGFAKLPSGGPGGGTGDMQAANNLSELTDPPTARGNLGLGDIATRDASEFDAAGTAGTALVAAQTYADDAILNAIEALDAADIGALPADDPSVTNARSPTGSAGGAVLGSYPGSLFHKSWKVPCRAATTGNIALTGTQTIDGVALSAGDRVLVKDQSTGSQNGIYDVAAGAWVRSADADASASVPSGTAVFVTEGTINGGFGFRLTTADPITLGTTSLAFAATPVRNIGKAGTDTTQEGGVKLGTSAEETISSNVAISATATWHNVDTSGGVRTITLPNSAAVGSLHTIDDSTGSFGTNKCTVQSETASSLRSGASLVSSVDLTNPGGTWTFKKMTATVWKLLGGAA